MLRESAAATDTPLDLVSVADPGRDPLIPGGKALLTYVDALTIGRTDTVAAAAAVLQELGPGGLMDAAGNVGAYEMMNRVADATGVPMGKRFRETHAEISDALRIDEWGHS